MTLSEIIIKPVRHPGRHLYTIILVGWVIVANVTRGRNNDQGGNIRFVSSKTDCVNAVCLVHRGSTCLSKAGWVVLQTQPPCLENPGSHP